MPVHSPDPGMTPGVERDESNTWDRLDRSRLRAAHLSIWAQARMYGLGCMRPGMCFQYSHSVLEKEFGNQDACVLMDTQMGDVEAETVHLPDF